MTANLDSFDLNLAVDKIYSFDFIWTEFCDWYIEMAKPRLYGEDEAQKANVRAILVHVLKNSMKLLHPFMPFITEDIYTRLPGSEETIMLSAWPKADAAFSFPAEAAAADGLMDNGSARNPQRSRRDECSPCKTGACNDRYKCSKRGGTPAQQHRIVNKLAGASTVSVQLDKSGIDRNAVSVVSTLGEAGVYADE